MTRSLTKTLWIACLLAIAAAGALPASALAHGGGHDHAAATRASTHRTTADGERGSSQAVTHGEHAGSLTGAETPSHCPDGPLGGCCCGHAVLLHHVPAVANAPGFELVHPARAHDIPVPLREGAYRRAFFLYSAPPRAPPFSPVAA